MERAKRIRNRHDNREGYAISEFGGYATVIWDSCEGVEVITEKDYVIHEDDASIENLYNVLCRFVAK